MSFRNRLTLFFVLIVIVPMVAVAVVLFRLISDNEDGKADARLAAEQNVAINMYKDATARALATLGTRRVGRAALRRRCRTTTAARRARGRRAPRSRRARGGSSSSATATPVIDVGTKKAIAPTTRPLVDAQALPAFGDLRSPWRTRRPTPPPSRRTTGADAVVVWIDDTQVASTIERSAVEAAEGQERRHLHRRRRLPLRDVRRAGDARLPHPGGRARAQGGDHRAGREEPRSSRAASSPASSSWR